MAKCPICDGEGYVYNALGDFNEDCVYCQRTGRVRVEGEPMTKQEYMQTCNTEQLAEVLSNISTDAWFAGLNDMDRPVGQKDNWQQWLKQPYGEENEE